jgi:hypothetical protein
MIQQFIRGNVCFTQIADEIFGLYRRKHVFGAHVSVGLCKPEDAGYA